MDPNDELPDYYQTIAVYGNHKGRYITLQNGPATTLDKTLPWVIVPYDDVQELTSIMLDTVRESLD